jgi:hypothetical protein
MVKSVLMRPVCVVFALVGFVQTAPAAINGLPPEFQHILDSATNVALYSLEPLSTRTGSVGRLDGFEILGWASLDRDQAKHAAGIFAKAVADWDGLNADCFDPRHALHIVDQGRAYDFLLCYACEQLVIYRDGQEVAQVGASGSPTALNNLLRELHLPVSHSGDKEISSIQQTKSASHQRATQ